VDVPHFDARVNRRDGLDRPRPIRSGIAVAAVGLLPLTLGLTGVIRPLSGLVFAAIFLAVGALQSSLAQFELMGMRRRADLELRREPRPYLLSSLAQWRAHELTSDGHRLALARTVARTERDLSPALLPGASPLNRVAARPHVDFFRALIERLAALDRPVTPQAVLQVEGLLTSSASPLYARERAWELRPALLASIRALDGSPEWLAVEQVPTSGQRPIRAGGNGAWALAGKTRRPLTATLGLAQTRLRRLAMPHRKAQR
jgi:hypothetical protein